MKFPLVVLLAALISLPAFAQGTQRAGQETGGGDPSRARAEALRSVIAADLKFKLLTYVNTVDPATLTGAGSAQILAMMVARGLKEDISQSPYVVRPTCPSGNGVDPASTQMGGRGAEICFNVAELARLGVTEAELLALTLHEHAHHFGFGEADARTLEVSIVESLARPLAGTSSWSCTANCYAYASKMRTRLYGYQGHSEEALVVGTASNATAAFIDLNQRCQRVLDSIPAAFINERKYTLRALDRAKATIDNTCRSNY